MKKPRFDDVSKSNSENSNNNQTANQKLDRSSFLLYKRLLGYTFVHKKMLIFSILAVCFSGLTEASLSLLLKPILDKGFVGKDAQFIQLMPYLIVGVFLIMSVLSFLGNVGMQKIAQNVVVRLREQMFHKLLTLPVNKFDEQPAGVLLSKLTYDANQLLTISSFALVTLIKDTATILGLLFVMFSSDWKLSLMMFGTAPLIALVLRLVSKRLRRLSVNIQNEMGGLNHVVEETIRGHKEIRLYGATDQMAQRFYKINHRLKGLNIRTMIASEIASPLTQLMVVLLIAVLMGYAGNQIANSQLTVGGFLSLLAAMVMLLNPIKRLTRLNESLQRGLAGADSIFTLLDEADEAIVLGDATLDTALSIGSDATNHDPLVLHGDITLKNVNFNYGTDGRTALKNINLHIKAGQTVALVGASGSGKTTLANLIARFYMPSSGQILMDDRNIADSDLIEFRSNIAFVGQSVVLFADSIANNIAFGINNRASLAEIVAATKHANADEFIQKLPDGLNTLIGENGTRLSGGQRQRLAIARAFLKNAPILILDEATSNLDTESEFLIQKSMENLLKDRTTLIIAHRLSTIEKADVIVVLSQGEIVEQGSHSELISQNGIYAKLHRMGDVIDA